MTKRPAVIICALLSGVGASVWLFRNYRRDREAASHVTVAAQQAATSARVDQGKPLLEFPGDWLSAGIPTPVNPIPAVPRVKASGQVELVPLERFTIYLDEARNFVRAHHTGIEMRTVWDVDKVKFGFSNLIGSGTSFGSGVTFTGIPKVSSENSTLQQCLGRTFGDFRPHRSVVDVWLVQVQQPNSASYEALLLRDCRGHHEVLSERPFASIVFWSIIPLDPELERKGLGGSFSVTESYEDGFSPFPDELVKWRQHAASSFEQQLEEAKQQDQPKEVIEQLTEALRHEQDELARALHLYPDVAAGNSSPER
ncbi:MAG: hypothetical protein ACR2OZ_07450 [Verrucomicrobiales bacterium]